MDLKAADERSSSTAPGFASSSSTPIDSSNVGFKLLQKHGWKEGTGLGISEQGRLEPVQAIIKTNKRGLGAEKPKRSTNHTTGQDMGDTKLSKQKEAGVISKKKKKMQRLEEQFQEKEFDRAFFREFWPDNV